MPGSGDREVMDRDNLQPTADTPRMPAGYLELKRLPWSWARVRLERARNYWVASVSERGTPHSRPVWGVWVDGGFYFSSGSRIRRNAERRPEVTVHLESGRECVIVEGRSEIEENVDVLRAVAAAYKAKYTWDMKATPGEFLRVQPGLVFGWISDDSGEDGGATFAATATRWSF